jgi:hypothetical protein
MLWAHVEFTRTNIAPTIIPKCSRICAGCAQLMFPIDRPATGTCRPSYDSKAAAHCVIAGAIQLGDPQSGEHQRRTFVLVRRSSAAATTGIPIAARGSTVHTRSPTAFRPSPMTASHQHHRVPTHRPSAISEVSAASTISGATPNVPSACEA